MFMPTCHPVDTNSLLEVVRSSPNPCLPILPSRWFGVAISTEIRFTPAAQSGSLQSGRQDSGTETFAFSRNYPTGKADSRDITVPSISVSYLRRSGRVVKERD